MHIQTFKSDGLAHLSYLIVEGPAAAVIDPRRDVDCYLEEAYEHGASIRYVFETHRNEDLISGAPILSERTGARVLHGPNADGEVRYADTVHEGDCFELDHDRIQVLETPGHTFDSVSYVLYDDSTGDRPLAVFTGDALFVDDVGRTDFYPDQAERVAGLLYDSLHKLLALGDQTIVYPAHGAGSVCGSGMAERDFSTIGYERECNDRLQLEGREAFIEAKLAEHHDQPPYFRRMEQLNLSGAPAMPAFTLPPGLPVAAIDEFDDVQLVDTRSVTAFMGAHLEGSLALPVGMISAFAGWYLDYDRQLLLMSDDPAQARDAATQLMRMGFDDIVGFVKAPFPARAAEGHSFASLSAVDVETVAGRLEGVDTNWQLLDVRADDELEEGTVPGARHLYAGELPHRMDELDDGVRYTTMCESGARATIAASALRAAGFQADVFLGSVGAWTSVGRDLVEAP